MASRSAAIPRYDWREGLGHEVREVRLEAPERYARLAPCVVGGVLIFPRFDGQSDYAAPLQRPIRSLRMCAGDHVPESSPMVDASTRILAVPLVALGE